MRHRSRRVGSAWLAQEEEERRSYRVLIKTLIGFRETAAKRSFCFRSAGAIVSVLLTH
jgi:hypothetical protein